MWTTSELQAAEITADDRLTIQGGNGGAELRLNAEIGTVSETRFLIDNYTTRLEFGFVETGAGGAFTIPMTIKPNAPLDSLKLDSSGVLIGSDLITNGGGALRINHEVNPTIRLQESLTNQAFEIGASDGLFGSASGGFYFSNLNRTPLAIEGGQLGQGIYVDSNGQLGLGTTAPGTLLHGVKVHGNGLAESIARFEISDDAVGRLEVNNATTTNGVFIPRLQGRSKGNNAALIMEAIIETDGGLGPAIVYNTLKTSAGGPTLVNRPMVVYRNNNVAKVTVFANGQMSATAFNVSSSRTVKNNIANLDSRRAVAALRELTPVEFVYKDDEQGERYVGFIAEDVPELVASADRKSVPMMDVVAVLTRVVKDQQQAIESQAAMHHQQSKVTADRKKSIEDQAATVDDLMKLLTSLESSMQDDQ